MRSYLPVSHRRLSLPTLFHFKKRMMLTINLSISCAILILFQNAEGSLGMEPSTGRSRRAERTHEAAARNYLVTTHESLANLEDDRLDALRALQFTSNPSRKQVYQAVAERLGRKRNKVEGDYLSVLKGYPIPGPAERYTRGSEEGYVTQMMERGAPLPPIVDDNRRRALTNPSALAAPHARIFQEPNESISLQNFVRLHHDRARVRLENINDAFQKIFKTQTYSSYKEGMKTLYNRLIAREESKLETDRVKQKLALQKSMHIGFFEPQGRKRTEEKVIEYCRKHNMDYENYHGFMPQFGECSAVTDNAPPHASGLRTPEEDLFPDGDGHAVYHDINDAMQKNLDEIDVLTQELNDIRANPKKMRKLVAKNLYNVSITKLQDRIEVIRRELDKFAEGEMVPIPRNRYIPGSENRWLRRAFRQHGLNWDQEHAHSS